MSKCCENVEDCIGEGADEESEKEWICMQADLETIEALSQEAQERDLSIDEYFVRSFKRYEEQATR